MQEIMEELSRQAEADLAQVASKETLARTGRCPL